MKKIFALLVFVFSFNNFLGQVGINTNCPTAALEVVGNVKTEGSMFLENPGDETEIRGSKFLINSTTNQLLRYDINSSKYGPINYAEFAFKEVATDGLLLYDTKISTIDYLVSIQGYSFFKAGSLGGIMPHSLLNDLNIEGYQVYAFANPVTQTWCLKAFVNNSQFQYYSSGAYSNTMIDLYLNIIIYRKGFITKQQASIAVDMGDSETIVAPMPAGF
jgi:hypothetical protein